MQELGKEEEKQLELRVKQGQQDNWEANFGKKNYYN
jgi:hypothetical protein